MALENFKKDVSDRASIGKHSPGKNEQALPQHPPTSSDQSDPLAFSLAGEAANMRLLQSRQAAYVTPLYLSSQRAQAVLKQF